jgi:hypothetical protein
MKKRFEDLAIGETFDWISENCSLNSFFEPCRKVDTFRYVAMTETGQDNPRYGTMRVGSTNTYVYHAGRIAS